MLYPLDIILTQLKKKFNLVSERIPIYSSLLLWSERECSEFGGQLNANNTKVISFKYEGKVNTLNGTALVMVDDFKYLGAWMHPLNNMSRFIRPQLAVHFKP